MSNIKYRSGNFTVATPVGILRNESPLLPELNDVLVFHQDFVQLAANFVRLDYNTPNPDLLGDTAYLFNESPREDYGGNCVKWTRSWSRIPISYGKAGGTYPYPFPAFSTSVQNTSREVLEIAVAMEILRDFFLCGEFGALTSWQEIPIIPAFRPYLIQADGDTTITSTDTDSRGFLLSDPNPSIPTLGTSPSIADYKAMIAAGTIIDVQDSKVTNFRGGIYMRERYTVKAR